jgi:glyoxylase-like metal-dependent hydrolase (beta-lactamase superfamily II)
MTAHALVTRRMVLKDMGKAGLAVVVLGVAGCSEEPTDETTPTEEPGTASTEPSTSTTSTSTSTSSGSTSTTSESTAGHEWHRVNLGFVSAYILYRNGEATIVDTGVEGSEGSIEAALAEIGLGWGDVGALVVTHLHPDHQGSVPAVVQATTEVLPWFAGAADIDRIDAPTEGQAVGDGDTVNEGLQIIETPGHTPGHISVLDPVAGILVAGDALNGANGGVVGANPSFSEDMDLANDSVAKLAGFDYEVALFGHGEPVLKGAATQVADLAQSLDGG